jgi:hypothetical protein
MLALLKLINSRCTQKITVLLENSIGKIALYQSKETSAGIMRAA